MLTRMRMILKMILLLTNVYYSYSYTAYTVYKQLADQEEIIQSCQSSRSNSIIKFRRRYIPGSYYYIMHEYGMNSGCPIRMDTNQRLFWVQVHYACKITYFSSNSFYYSYSQAMFTSIQLMLYHLKTRHCVNAVHMHLSS